MTVRIMYEMQFQEVSDKKLREMDVRKGLREGGGQMVGRLEGWMNGRMDNLTDGRLEDWITGTMEFLTVV